MEDSANVARAKARESAILTPDQVREVLDYDPDSGTFIWKKRPKSYFATVGAFKAWNTKFSGMEAFTYFNTGGYLVSKMCGLGYTAHRVAWAHYYRSWPKGDVDHIDHDRTNNAVSNLRVVTIKENAQNAAMYSTNTSGVNGVTWHKLARKWQAQIKVSGKCVYLGLFEDLGAAADIRRAAEVKYGFHENHGA